MTTWCWPCSAETRLWRPAQAQGQRCCSVAGRCAAVAEHAVEARLPRRGRRLRREQLPERPSGQIELRGRGRHVWRRRARALAAAPARPQVLEQRLHALQLQLRAPVHARVSGLVARGQSGAATLPLLVVRWLPKHPG